MDGKPDFDELIIDGVLKLRSNSQMLKSLELTFLQFNLQPCLRIANLSWRISPKVSILTLVVWTSFTLGTLSTVKIDCRLVTAGIKATQWPGYMNEIMRVLKPGTGWAQCAELAVRPICTDGSVPEDATVFEVLPHKNPTNGSISIRCRWRWLHGVLLWTVNILNKPSEMLAS